VAENNLERHTLRHRLVGEIRVHQNHVLVCIVDVDADARGAYRVNDSVRYIRVPVTEQHVLEYHRHANSPSGRMRISRMGTSTRSSYALGSHVRMLRARRCFATMNTSLAVVTCLRAMSWQVSSSEQGAAALTIVPSSVAIFLATRESYP